MKKKKEERKQQRNQFILFQSDKCILKWNPEVLPMSLCLLLHKSPRLGPGSEEHGGGEEEEERRRRRAELLRPFSAAFQGAFWKEWSVERLPNKGGGQRLLFIPEK